MTTVELRTPATYLGEPESSAEPKPDREPDRTHEPTRCSWDSCPEPPVIPHQRAWWCAAHAPRDALQATHVPRVGETPRATAGMISPRGVVGYQPDGTRADGNASWEWRPPLPQPVRGHDEMALASAHGITSGGVMGYQPAPPVHVHGDHPGSARDVRRNAKARAVSEQQAVTLYGELAQVPPEVLGLSDSQLRRRRKGRRTT